MGNLCLHGLCFVFSVSCKILIQFYVFGFCKWSYQRNLVYWVRLCSQRGTCQHITLAVRYPEYPQSATYQPYAVGLGLLVGNGGDGLLILKVAANVLCKRLRMVYKRWFSGFWCGSGTNNPLPRNTATLQTFKKDSDSYQVWWWCTWKS
jgi:hypothetical protein